MEGDRAAAEVRAALAAAADEQAPPAERAEMLMEIAMGLQQRPKTPEQIQSAIELYDKALEVCPEDERLLRARITARKGTALQAVPGAATTYLEQARAAFAEAIPTLIDFGLSAGVAHLRQGPLPARVRDSAEQPGDRLPVDAVHRRARQDARGPGGTGLRGRS